MVVRLTAEEVVDGDCTAAGATRRRAGAPAREVAHRETVEAFRRCVEGPDRAPPARPRAPSHDHRRANLIPSLAMSVLSSRYTLPVSSAEHIATVCDLGALDAADHARLYVNLAAKQGGDELTQGS